MGAPGGSKAQRPKGIEYVLDGCFVFSSGVSTALLWCISYFVNANFLIFTPLEVEIIFNRPTPYTCNLYLYLTSLQFTVYMYTCHMYM